MNWLLKTAVLSVAVVGFVVTQQQPADNAQRMLDSQRFHYDAVQKPGLLVPLYIYPDNIAKNAAYDRIMDLRRRFPEVPFWVILNPASGPGSEVNANYTKAIDRLIGSGCTVLGYVPTGYGKVAAEKVASQMQSWRTMYPRLHGIFFDEMIYEPTAAGVAHQVKLNSIARDMGFWPTVGNPGADTPGAYFAADCADVIVVHESGDWPTEKKLHGDYFGGHADYPAWTRSVLVHSQAECDAAAIAMITRYSRWIYVTQDTYKPNDPAHNNPWDQLSTHLETMCEMLAK